MKYSFLMPYLDRAAQFKSTLESFVGFYGDRNDFEIVLVEDTKNFGSSDHYELETLVKIYCDKIPFIIRTGGDEKTMNPAPLFNIAAAAAHGRYFILTSPEVYHTVDILGECDDIFGKQPLCYVVCACESIREGKHHAWFQHSQFRASRSAPANRMFHFCTVIPRMTYEMIGGFDEDLAYGISYDDDDLIERIKLSGVPIIVRDDLHTVHQPHSKIRPPNSRELLIRNQRIYEQKSRLRKTGRASNN